MGRDRVLITDIAWDGTDIEHSVLDPLNVELILAETGSEDELLELAPEAVAIMTNWKQVPASVLERAPRCLTVARYGVGVDNIAVDRATALGIVVSNVPDYCVEEVSDHTVALLLACARRVVRFARDTRDGRWDLRGPGPLPRLRSQTVGFLGFGRMARAVARKLSGFDMRILVHDPYLVDAPDGVETADMQMVVADADYLCVHTPLTAETRGLISESLLRAMKSSAYLINTSRGRVVDQAALHRALREGWIAGAALDVLEEEPPAADDPLLRLDNLIVTPHAAFSSTAAIAELQERTAENVATVLRGDLPATVINREVVERRRQPSGAAAG